MASSHPSERSLISSYGAHMKWATTPDRKAATAAARTAFLARFEKLVDPDGVMDAETRTKLAESRKAAYFKDLARRSAQVRRARRATGPETRSA